jgi:glycosyltransferase involved in cell wall biosynthesis
MNQISVNKKPSLFFITSHPMSVISFMSPHIKALISISHVTVLANSNDSTLLQQRGIDVVVEPVRVLRHIAPLADIKALWNLYWRLKRSAPYAVHTITPKAGLLGMVAAWLARVPLRVHSFTGQVWVTQTGFKRWLLKTADKCISAMATDVLVDSPSQRAFLIEQGVLTAAQSSVLGAGSISGVNTQRFCPSEGARQAVRNQLCTSNDTLVCLYLGRLTKDKGLLDLAKAFAQVASAHIKAELWIVGPDEDNLFDQMLTLLNGYTDRVKRVGYTLEPERFMQAADMFCLPSYREGFGSSVIEAAACGVPAIVSRIYGLTDAVIEGQTGLMHEPGNVQDLAKQLDRLFANPAELLFKGEAAKKYCKLVFSEESITGAMLDFYKSRLN